MRFIGSLICPTAATVGQAKRFGHRHDDASRMYVSHLYRVWLAVKSTHTWHTQQTFRTWPRFEVHRCCCCCCRTENAFDLFRNAFRTHCVVVIVNILWCTFLRTGCILQINLCTITTISFEIIWEFYILCHDITNHFNPIQPHRRNTRLMVMMCFRTHNKPIRTWITQYKSVFNPLIPTHNQTRGICAAGSKVPSAAQPKCSSFHRSGWWASAWCPQSGELSFGIAVLCYMVLHSNLFILRRLTSNNNTNKLIHVSPEHLSITFQPIDGSDQSASLSNLCLAKLLASVWMSTSSSLSEYIIWVTTQTMRSICCLLNRFGHFSISLFTKYSFYLRMTT